MSQKKSLQELTIKNNFMFAAVMMNPQNCQELLELILNIPISYVKVDTERSLLYDPRYRGIRMDVYVRDENNTRFDVEMPVQDGHHTIFLNTRGKNREEVPAPLVRFLEFVKADPGESEKDFGDGFVRRLQESVRQVRASREMGERYMWLELALRDERIAGKAEGILDLLEDLGEVPESLRERILSIRDGRVLQKLLKIAARADSIEAFEKLSEL